LLLDPERKPYLWQRGLVLYYLKRFDDAIVQFASDFEANCFRSRVSTDFSSARGR